MRLSRALPIRLAVMLARAGAVERRLIVMSIEDIERYVQETRDLFARGGFASIVDLRRLDARYVTPRGRRRIAAFVNDLVRRYPDALVSEAVVVDSLLLRGAHTAYTWLRSDWAAPSRAFQSEIDAEEWTLQALQRAGIDPPPGASLRFSGQVQRPFAGERDLASFRTSADRRSSAASWRSAVPPISQCHG